MRENAALAYVIFPFPVIPFCFVFQGITPPLSFDWEAGFNVSESQMISGQAREDQKTKS